MVSRNVLLEERGEPKIGGSVGGFIALVVCLILVIIVACTAIIFLLRHDSSEAGQRARRQRRYHHQPDLSSSSYTYDPSSSPSKSWFASLQGMFTGAAGSVRYNAARRMKNRDGWLQATGDEWDDSHDERLRNMGNPQYMAYSPALDPPFRPPGITTTESTSSVHFEPQSDSRIPNRFASSAESPTSSVHSLPPVEIPIPRSASPEAMSVPQAPPSAHIERENSSSERKDSAQSDISTRTGTKFIEGL